MSMVRAFERWRTGRLAVEHLYDLLSRHGPGAQIPPRIVPANAGGCHALTHPSCEPISESRCCQSRGGRRRTTGGPPATGDA